MSSFLQMSMVAHCPSDKRTVSFHIKQPCQKIKRTWEENSLLTNKLAKSEVSLHASRLHQKGRTWEENSLLTSKLAKSTVSLRARQLHQKSRPRQENSLLTSKSKRTGSLHTRQLHQKSRT